jgi:tetratricopeptide (TPR) repeat protein
VTVDRDFFISFTGPDRPWAEWLLAELDAAGYTSVSQLRDFVAGANFALDMDRAARRASRTLGVLSPRALEAPYVQQEWAQRLASDPTATQRALVLVRVEPCQLQGLLGPVVYIDLVGLDEASARERLREELAAVVRGERRLPTSPMFPRGGPAADVPALQRPRFPTALPLVWNLPFRRNPDFIGREQELAELAARLGRGAAAVTQTLLGAGGVGKTALAVEYAYRYRSQFDAVWWIRAEQPATLVGDYADLAAALGLLEGDQPDQQLAARAVRRWLEGHDRWLLVLDNAEAAETPTGLSPPLARLVDLIPQVLHGQVLVTSRDASWEEHAGLAELEVFTPGEAVAFLLARTGSTERATAGEISELLGFLPLAVEQAGAYVRQTRLSLHDYLNRLRQYPALTMTRGRPRDRDPADTVATTWQLSMERVRPTPGAVALLEVCAFLGPEEIPRELFSQQLNPPTADLEVLAEDPFALDDAVGALRRFGLVKADAQTLSVHRLVQQVVRDQVDPEQHRRRATAALRLILAAFPTQHTNPDAWPTYARLLPHVLAVTGAAQRLGIEPDSAAWLLNQAGLYLWQRADHTQAGSLHQRALAIRETRLGSHHPDTAETLNNLAAVLRAQGDLAGARPLLVRALAVREACLGADHPDTAETLNNLGLVMRGQGDSAGARGRFERALAIRERQLGADHPDTAWSLGNLAKVLQDQGDLDGARRLQQRAMTIREHRLGADHPDTAWSLGSLGEILRRLGDLTTARHLLERAVAIRETRLGPEHPATAYSLNNLAAVLRDQGDLDEARRLHERALTIWQTRLGPEHPYTAGSLNGLGVVLRAQGDLATARHLLERAVAIREAHLGSEHRHTVTSLSHLADVLRDQGDLDGARSLHERALAIRERRLGPNHPDTVTSRRNLAAVIAALENRR